MIDIKEVDVVFDVEGYPFYAVKNASLTIEKGDIYGVVGYSGAGKSTLVRTINLLQRPQNGEIIIDGIDMVKLNAIELRSVRKKIGMIFQHFNLLESKNAYQNVAFPLKLSRLSREEKHHKIIKLLKLVGLEDKQNAYPNQLSGGQKQRIAIARALANDPEILLCDEATSALDPQTTDEVLQLLKKLNIELGLTIVCITHDMNVIKNLCSKVAVMQGGEIVEKGDIIKIFSTPSESITKAFINSATHIDSALEKVVSHRELLHLNRHSLIARITYVGEETSQPFISRLVSEMNVTVNIISGNIVIIRETPIGSLIIAISGKTVDIKKAISYLKAHHLSIDVVKKPNRE